MLCTPSTHTTSLKTTALELAQNGDVLSSRLPLRVLLVCHSRTFLSIMDKLMILNMESNSCLSVSDKSIPVMESIKSHFNNSTTIIPTHKPNTMTDFNGNVTRMTMI